MAQVHDANAPVFMWCFFMEAVRDSHNYVPQRGEKVCPYVLAHSHVKFKSNRAGSLAYCHISHETRTKMGLRSIASILLCEAVFSGFAGYWFLAIETGTLFVCDAFTVIETEMPFCNPRVWAGLGMTFGDRNATFKPQLVAKYHPSLSNKLSANCR